MSKRFTIIVPEALWPLACLIVAARGEVGRGMLNVRLIKGNDVFYSCAAGGALDDPGTYSRFGDAQGTWDYLQSINEQPLPFTVADVAAVYAAAIVIEHAETDENGRPVVVTDEVFAGLGLEIVEIVTVFPEGA